MSLKHSPVSGGTGYVYCMREGKEVGGEREKGKEVGGGERERGKEVGGGGERGRERRKEGREREREIGKIILSIFLSVSSW